MLMQREHAPRRRQWLPSSPPIIALLMVIAYQGATAAQGQPPPAPQNPMAHLIAGDGQEPQVRVSWDAPRRGDGGQPHRQPERWSKF